MCSVPGGGGGFGRADAGPSAAQSRPVQPIRSGPDDRSCGLRPGRRAAGRDDTVPRRASSRSPRAGNPRATTHRPTAVGPDIENCAVTRSPSLRYRTRFANSGPLPGRDRESGRRTAMEHALNVSDRWFLKIDGIDGDSTSVQHKGEIDVQSWSWGVARPARRAGASGGGGGAGRASFQDFHFVSRISKASPALFLACATGQHHKEATLTGERAGSAKGGDLPAVQAERRARHERSARATPPAVTRRSSSTRSTTRRSSSASSPRTPRARSGRRSPPGSTSRRTRRPDRAASRR